MESEHFATNEKVEGSSPSVSSNFAQMTFWPQRVSAGSCQPPLLPPTFFRGRLTGRTAGSEPVNRGSNPFPETISILDFGLKLRNEFCKQHPI